MQRHVKPYDNITADEKTESGKEHQRGSIHAEPDPAKLSHRRKQEKITRDRRQRGRPFQRGLIVMHEDARQPVRTGDQDKIYGQINPEIGKNLFSAGL